MILFKVRSLANKNECSCQGNFVGYVDDKYHMGSTAGRVANRIKNGIFRLDGIEYQLEKNDHGKHHLHGVFHKRAWKSSIEHRDTVVFQYRSPDGIN